MKKDISLNSKLLFVDAKTEGKKEGYDLASKEYKTAIEMIEKEYADTISLIESNKKSYEEQAEQLLNKLEELERKRDELESIVVNKSEKVARVYNVLPINVKKGLAAGTLFADLTTVLVAVGIIYKVKKINYIKGKKEGYIEAKLIFEEKIRQLKKKLNELIEKSDADIKDILDKISLILDAIAKAEANIAELSMLL